MMMGCDSGKSQRIEMRAVWEARIGESTHLQALCLGELSVQLQPPASQRADEGLKHRVANVLHIGDVAIVITFER